MTALHLSDVATAIAALDIEGVTIKDLDEMPQAVDERECPVLGPSSHDPAFLTDWEQTRISVAGNRQMVYTLNYKLFQAPVGKDRGLFKQFPALVDTAQKIADAFNGLTAVTGCKHIRLEAMPAFGPVADASAQLFHGATLAFRVTEF